MCVPSFFPMICWGQVSVQGPPTLLSGSFRYSLQGTMTSPRPPTPIHGPRLVVCVGLPQFPSLQTPPGDFSPRMKQRFPSALWQLGPLVFYLDPNRPKKASQTLQAVDWAGPGHIPMVSCL